MARGFEVAVMHDFFIDRLVHVKKFDPLLRSVRKMARSGGGGMHAISQSEIRGGNAVNLAHALARLRVKTLLITHSDPAHEGMIRGAFEGLEAEVRVKPRPPGLTVAFEEKTNVMLGENGGAGSFGAEELDQSDWQSLKKTPIVCAVNWAANRKGTELVAGLRKRLGKRTTIFTDPADFRERLAEFKVYLDRVATEGLADWVSMNEEEASTTARLLKLGVSGPRDTCRALSRSLGVRFDLHARAGGCTSDGTRTFWSGARALNARRLTGAGDVWDAGAIYGSISGMPEEERMRFANAAAKLYVRSREAVGPTLPEVLREM
ncbi:MAG: carbohydrate kinase family protein [Thaumarchaeota archaeon]|nr:carbohydrate kinase family protein [Nitrososphaerota archaeon]